MAAADADTHAHGWTAVPRSLSALIASRKNPSAPTPFRTQDVALPFSDLTNAVTRYASQQLNKQTFSHSMRVFYYGTAIYTQHFPEWAASDPDAFAEAYLLACLLHDIGTTEANIGSTRLSFEFKGGLLALDLLNKEGAPQPLAEVVAETVIRHQDVGDEGSLAALTAVIHFATLFDNVGGNSELVHKETIENVVAAWPRMGWTGCFAGVVRKEVALKPWSHTTKIPNFAEKVEANELMRPYDLLED